MSVETIIAVVLGGFVCEFIDASMGMMYGTILSPVLIIAGFEPVLVMGIILLSGFEFTFSWKKMIAVGVLSAFNKGMSGGEKVNYGIWIEFRKQKGSG